MKLIFFFHPFGLHEHAVDFCDIVNPKESHWPYQGGNTKFLGEIILINIKFK